MAIARVENDWRVCPTTRVRPFAPSRPSWHPPGDGRAARAESEHRLGDFDADLVAVVNEMKAPRILEHPLRKLRDEARRGLGLDLVGGVVAEPVEQ